MSTVYELAEGDTRYRLIELTGRHRVIETDDGFELAWEESAAVGDFLMTEGGDFLMTEAGDYLTTEV